MGEAMMLSDRTFMSNLSRLALPIAAQSLMLSAVGVADTLMLGGVEQNAMAAVSLASKFQFLQNMVLSSVVAALVILGAQYWGKRDEDTVNRVFSIALRLCGLTSVLFFAACEFFPEIMMRAFTNDPELNRIASEYLRIAAWSYLLTGFSQCYLGLLKISDHAGDTAVISSAAVVINIVLNAVLIFGLAGEPMGVRGAAAATLTARAAELIWTVALSFRKNYIRPDYSRFFHRNAVLTRDFFRCMLPLLGAGLLWGVGFTAYSAFMGHIDQDAPAANSVASVVRNLGTVVCFGTASAAAIILGKAMGDNRLAEAKAYASRFARLAVLTALAGGAMAVFVFVFLLTL